MAISLIKSYDLFSQLTLVQAKKATREELSAFHSNEYLDYCEKSSSTDDLEKLEIHTNDRFGIGNFLHIMMQKNSYFNLFYFLEYKKSLKA